MRWKTTSDNSRRSLRNDDRGISWTLDALAMGAIMIGALVIAMQAAPTQADQSIVQDYSQAQLQQDGNDILTAASATGDLKNTTLYWDDSESTWVDAGGQSTYISPPLGHPMDRELRQIFQQDGISYNVEVQYQTVSGAYEDERIVYQGTPGQHAVVVSSHLISIQDDTSLAGPDAGTTVSESSSFYAPDAFPASSKYNELRVYIVLWRS
jgi:hypothetical protein